MFTACGLMHRRCCRLVIWTRWNEIPPHPGYLPAASSVHYTTSCKHSLVLLRMGEIIARNMLIVIGNINKPLLLHLVGSLYYFILFARLSYNCILIVL